MKPKKIPLPVDLHVGQRVRSARIEIGMSQERLGEALALTFQQVQKYEKGTNRIGSSRLMQIATALRKPVAWFYEGAPGGTGGPVPKGPDIRGEFFAVPRALDLARAFVLLDAKKQTLVIHLVRALAEQPRSGGRGSVMKYTPHPTDDSLVIGDNGRVYVATRLPESGWQFAEAWDILDTLPPDAIPDVWRLFLCGLIAGRLSVTVEATRAAFPQNVQGGYTAPPGGSRPAPPMTGSGVKKAH